MYCKKCGSQLNETDKFCKNCGEANNAETIVQPTQSVVQPQNEQPISNPTPNNNKDNNKTIIIIVAIIVGVLVALGVGYFVFNGSNNKPKTNDKKSSKNINDYEDDVVPDLTDDDIDIDDDTINTNTTTDTTNNNDTQNTNDTITYKKFRFNKLAGYTYEEKNDGLQVSDGSSMTLLNIIDGSFDIIKNNSDKLESAFTEKGYTVKNIQTKYYGSNEYISAEISQSGLSMILLYGEADSSHIYVIVVANKSYTIDYSLINKVNNIIKDATYVG